jgi:hypothetical protein
MGKFTSLFCCVFFFIYHFFYTKVFDGYVSVVCRCGTSATCILFEEHVLSSTRGHTCHRKGTNSSRRDSR